MRPRIAMFVVLSRARADGGCLPGWTQLGEECFKATTEQQGLDEGSAACSALHPSASVASIGNEEQSRQAAQLLVSDAWIGLVVENGQRSWLDGSICSYLPDTVTAVDSGRVCYQLMMDSKWQQADCASSARSLCSYSLTESAKQDACTCSSSFTQLPGFCEPNAYTTTLCSSSSSVTAANAATCEGPYAGNNLPIYGDWSKETGLAYFDPGSCNETCVRQRCLLDTACQGYTYAVGMGAGSLKSQITGSTPWGGYACMLKAPCWPTTPQADGSFSTSAACKLRLEIKVMALLWLAAWTSPLLGRAHAARGRLLDAMLLSAL